MKPVPPVTNAFTRRDSIREAAAAHAYTGWVQRSRNGRAAESRYGEGIRNPRARQRALLIAAGPDQIDLTELRELLRTAGVAVAGELTQQRSSPDPDRYFGKGKLAELKRAIAASDANLVACDDELLPRQERNLEQEVGVPVIDRTAIILDIFADHAASAEGKLQVELAQLDYNLARMRGLWTHLERLGGGIGTRGPGETQIETDRRLARDRIAALKRRLERTKAGRGLMRQERERAQLPTVALAGYTNAGKSTLLNAITGASAGVRERLFHTLDPTTRSFEISGRRYLLTDTVGFIRKLPHQLVDAFAATLEEALQADLILHVADRSPPLTTCSWRSTPPRGPGCSCSTRSTCSTRTGDASCPSATRTRCRSRPPRARASTRWRTQSRRASSPAFVRWSCSCPMRRAGGCPSCTTWRATWSARTRLRARTSGRGYRLEWRSASSASP